MSDTTANVLILAATVVGVIVCGSLYRWLRIRRGSDIVALRRVHETRWGVSPPVGHGDLTGLTGCMRVRLTDEEIEEIVEDLFAGDRHDEHEEGFV